MARARTDLSHLEARLGYSFRDRLPLERALTHISAQRTPAAGGPNYQRLEFLGDRVLGLSVAELLYQGFPEATEGELSRRLAHLVRRETCAEVAAEWDVGPFIRLGQGEMAAGLRKKEAILADVCEAIIAAVYLDGGFGPARDLVVRSFGPKMTEPGRSVRDPKSSLQEWALARGKQPPTYREIERSGPDHAPVFRISAEIDGFEPVIGEGRSKRLAEQAAAEAFMTREGVGKAVA
ncbi:ribonuclease III [Alsobacter sp. SYSU M60028]|uniref:Ribonuclease 3 n=2 Tax=Alsobacter ponti TaxID=2962936 RepID=A0ABT1LA39_9HYPH|nr:ribonuclease III [Alsobacter ponti]MCP8938372.1 ribonuclease III [Alsobacter ponti]